MEGQFEGHDDLDGSFFSISISIMDMIMDKMSMYRYGRIQYDKIILNIANA